MSPIKPERLVGRLRTWSVWAGIGLATATLCLLLSAYEGLQVQLARVLSSLEDDSFEVTYTNEQVNQEATQMRGYDPEGLWLLRSPNISAVIGMENEKPITPSPTFSEKDIEEIRQNPAIEQVAWKQYESPFAARKDLSLPVLRVPEELLRIKGLSLEAGRLPTPAEGDTAVVIGYRAAEQVFGGTDNILGQVIRPDLGTVPEGAAPPAALGGQTDRHFQNMAYEVRVVGILAPVPTERQAEDGMFDAGIMLLSEEPTAPLVALLVKPKAGQQLEAISAIKARYTPNDENTMVSLYIRPVRDVYRQRILAEFLVQVRQNFGWILGLSLLLAGVLVWLAGYLSVMLRYHEIGIRRSVGATRRQLVFQFLTEGLQLGLGGAGIGLMLTWVGQPLVTQLTGTASRMGSFTLVTGLLTPLLFALLVMLLPVSHATKLPPGDALRERPTFQLHRYRFLFGGPAIGLSMIALVIALALQDSLGTRMDQILNWTGNRTVHFVPWTITNDPLARPAYLTVLDYQAIKAQFPDMLVGWLGDTRKDVIDASVSLPLLRPIVLQSGRWFTEDEEASGKKVVVLGSAVAAEVAPHGDVNKIESWQGYPVVGILDDWELMVAEGYSKYKVYTPIGANIPFSDTYWASDSPLQPGQLSITIPPGEDLGKAINQLVAFLQNNHSEGEPQMVLPAGITADLLNSRNRVYDFMGLLAGVSLVVGALSLMNLTFIALLNRVPEIGIRRAIGATRGMIARQVLIETLLISSLSTLAGGVLGGLIAFELQHINGWPVTFHPDILLWLVLATVLSALIAGLLPAWWAANLSPTQAIRME